MTLSRTIAPLCLPALRARELPGAARRGITALRYAALVSLRSLAPALRAAYRLL
jgi:hypothetical protein